MNRDSLHFFWAYLDENTIYVLRVVVESLFSLSSLAVNVGDK